MKAASTLASETTPQVVLDILEEFGVAHCEDIPQEQRREFLGRVEDADSES